MSIIHINQIGRKIKELFGEGLDKESIAKSGEDYERNLRSKCLAAYGVLISTDCTIEEACSSVIDGNDDNGIDAIYYSSLKKMMVMVQSKWSADGKGEPDSSGVGKFCRGIEDLFNENYDRFNEKFNKIQPSIEKGLHDYETKYQIVLVDTHIKDGLGDHSMRIINDLLSKMNESGSDESEDVLSFIRYNQGKVHSTLSQSSLSEAINLELGLSNWGSINDPYKGYYGTVSGEEVLEWWKSHKVKLFDKNIRNVLGKTEVNQEIEETLKKKPEEFWYFNNGVTIIADEIQKTMVGGNNKDIGAFKLNGISIVNGAQTVSSIGKYGLKEGNLEKVRVPLRIISLKGTPEGFDKEVTKNNNRQNKIENRDFASQDLQQIRIKRELNIEGIEYSIMRSENFTLSEKAFDLQEATSALACASGKAELAVNAKRGIGRFFENLTGGMYRAIFNPSTNGIYVYNCVKVERMVSSILEDEIKSLPKKTGRKYGLLVHGNKIITLLAIRESKLLKDIKELDFELNRVQFKKEVMLIIGKMFKYLEENYSDNFLANLFKNTSKSNDLVQNIKL